MSLAFLFGAGSSIRAGLPSTALLTTRVLGDSDVFLHTSGRYLSGECPQAMEHSSTGALNRIRLLLQLLKSEADLYFYAERQPNYEDLQFMLHQIVGSLSGDLENPALNPLIRDLDHKLQSVLTEDPQKLRSVRRSNGDWYMHRLSNLLQVANEASNYIRDIVAAELSKPKCSVDYLSWIGEACRTAETNWIFSLNHDPLLDRLLQKLEVNHVDGFDQPDEHGVRYWRPELFDTCILKFVKLHGSVDWVWIRESKTEKRVSPGVAQITKVLPGVDITRPLILMGTHNKMSDYTNYLYEDLHVEFYNALKKVNRIVTCGYGFGDKGINSRLIAWLLRSKENRIVVVHPHPQNCQQHARAAIYQHWDHWVQARQLCPLPKKAEDVTWSEIKAFL